MNASPSSHKLYSVPNRFYVSELFVLTGAFAVLFGILRACEAHWLVYFFFAAQITTVGLAQMCFGRVPRIASTVSGILFVALFTFVAELVSRRTMIWTPGFVFFLLSYSVFWGSLSGYATGVLVAGAFLVADKFRGLVTWTRANTSQEHERTNDDQ